MAPVPEAPRIRPAQTRAATPIAFRDDDLVSGVSLLAKGYKGADLDPVGKNSSGEFGDQESLFQSTAGSNRGLGIDSDNTDNLGVDGGGGDEALRLFLGVGGTLTQIVFNRWSSSDDFDLAADGIVLLDDVSDADGIWDGSVAFTSTFAIGADGSNDAFLVRSITVDVPLPTSGAPEPGTVALFAIGLLGVGLHGRAFG